MNGFCIGAVLFFGVVAVFAIIGGMIITALRIRHGNLSRETRRFHDDETATIQEIFCGFSRMEKRLEALETILLGR